MNRKSEKQKSMLHEIDETLKSKQVIRGGKSTIHLAVSRSVGMRCGSGGEVV